MESKENMRNIKLVSVVVPVYNQEKYLDTSVPSILNQTYPDVEVVLVDDGSTDKSGTMCDEYAKLNDNVQVIHQKNGGLGAAVVTGVLHAQGQYVCFVDPDDNIGPHFVESFMREMTEQYDFIAMGFFQNDNGIYKACPLAGDAVYAGKEIDGLKKSFLYDFQNLKVSNRVYISRWHKLYRSDCARAVCTDYAKCGRLMLGEDSIFTYLALKYSKKIRVIRCSNSYYYNISNQGSMMHSADVERYLARCAETFNAFVAILQGDGQDLIQAYALYYFLVDALIRRVRNGDLSGKEELRTIYFDPIYNKAFKELVAASNSQSDKLKLKGRTSKTYPLYETLVNTRDDLKRAYRGSKTAVKNTLFYLDKARAKGFKQAGKLTNFHILRQSAFVDMNEQLPKIESDVLPIIKPYIGKSTDLDKCPIKKNVFVFWWDGFENASNIVQKCLQSVRKAFDGCTIVEITKHNFEDYTDIHPQILKAYRAGDISVQTFSDILRFNLLKNNGGAWIDSTIYFDGRFDIFKGLESKSYDSVDYAATSDFLSYQGEVCSWSGFFVASRKNGMLVTVMDTIFREYFLKHKKYPIYFFIDAAYMVCKLYGMDDNVLNKVSKYAGNMYALYRLLDEEYNADLAAEILRLPQKLAWNYVPNKSNDKTFYSEIIGKSNYER